MQHLFPPLSLDIRKALDALPAILDAVVPLNAAHKRDLPTAVAELSLQLTAERSALARPYWASPRFISAYLRYFLPWNLVRQVRLLSSLPLTPPTPLTVQEGQTIPRLLVDMGSGPLTFVIALWLARPQWRSLPLSVLCTDLSPHTMELGRAIFTALAGEDNPWHIRMQRGSVDTLATCVQRCVGAPWLISAANVLNEVKMQPGQQRSDKFEHILAQISDVLTLPDAQALFIEPGARLGGKTIMQLRELAREYHLSAVAPCPHTASCPLLESRTWCHFTFDTEGTPVWLHELSRAANLRKEALSLSFALLRPELNTPHDKALQARIVSAPLHVPGLHGVSRYACTASGMALLEDAASLLSGTLVNITIPQSGRRDAKSGAIIIPAYCHEGGKKAATRCTNQDAAKQSAQESLSRNRDSRHHKEMRTARDNHACNQGQRRHEQRVPSERRRTSKATKHASSAILPRIK